LDYERSIAEAPNGWRHFAIEDIERLPGPVRLHELARVPERELELVAKGDGAAAGLGNDPGECVGASHLVGPGSLPALLALALSLVQLVASRQVWPDAGQPPYGLSTARLVEHWPALLAVPLGLAMVFVDAYGLLVVGAGLPIQCSRRGGRAGTPGSPGPPHRRLPASPGWCRQIGQCHRVGRLGRPRWNSADRWPRPRSREPLPPGSSGHRT